MGRPLAGLFAAVLALTLIAGCGTSRPQQVVQVTQYNNGSGAPLFVPGDADKLAGASKAYKAYMADLARTAIEKDDGSCGESPLYTVRTFSNTGFAGGDFSRCGVKHLVWAKGAKGWAQVLSYDNDPRCASLKRLHIPPGITGTDCRDSGGIRPYKP